MFDLLRAVLEGLWERLIPFRVIRQYEMGGVFRFGKYHRTLQPGFHWQWPFVEETVTEHTCLTTLALEPQTITTRDDVSVVVRGIVKYRIVDVERFVCDIGNQHDLLCDTSMGAVLKQTRQIDLSTLRNDPPENKIASDIRRMVKPYGVEIEAFTFTDSGRIKTLRIMTHTHSAGIL